MNWHKDPERHRQDERPILDVERVKRLGLTALVIDDNHSIVRVVAALLRKHGFDVLTAYDGVEGLDKAITKHPDLIILDVVMPRLDGYEVACLLQNDPDTADIPILMLTVRGRVDDPQLDEQQVEQRVQERMKGFDVGALDFVSKPIKAKTLLRRVDGLLWWDLPLESTSSE